MNFDEFKQEFSKVDLDDLCIISDFDDTLTKGIRNDGSRGSNSFSVYANNPELLGEEYLDLTNKLFNHYYPIEQDPNLTFEEKEKFVVEWWEKEFNLYKEFGYTKETIQTIIKNKLMEFKLGVKNLIHETHTKNIPFIIFSAGIYDLIHGFVSSLKEKNNHIHVVANKFKFDSEGKFIGTQGDTIHSMNKTFTELSHLPVYDEIKSKKYCLLLGDSLSDVKMTEGSNFERVFKIGFLNVLPENEKYESKLKAHQEYYDLVLSGKDNFEKINELFKKNIFVN